jgi:hypothetical protein
MDLGGRDLAPAQFVVPEHILLYRLLDRIAKMKWFDRWFVKKWHWARNYGCEPTGAKSPSTSSVEVDHHALHDGVSMHLKQVIGGRLVTFSCYDRHRDESYSRTYIITDEQDFERELGKIITLESLRQC